MENFDVNQNFCHRQYLRFVGVLQTFYLKYVVGEMEVYLMKSWGNFNTHELRQLIMAARKLNVAHNSEIVNTLRMLEF